MEPPLRLDAARHEDARAILRACCGATRWVERMLHRRPFGTREDLLRAAREEWSDTDESDWLEAFSHHPRIGDKESLRQRFGRTADLSAREQSGVDGAADDVLDALAEGNRAYEKKFGHVFIVCATGRSAGEMLAMLRARMTNDPATERRTAAGEQAKITELRLLALA
jgi:2-oxo-4-hydroxy-4-carboxy-5-ureidoimidazoline decarboxylase